MSRQTCEYPNCHEQAVSFDAVFLCELHTPADVAVTK